MTNTEKDLITWAENYVPEENTLQFTEAEYIEDLQKCLDSYVTTLKKSEGTYIYRIYLDQLYKIRQRVEEAYPQRNIA